MCGCENVRMDAFDVAKFLLNQNNPTPDKKSTKILIPCNILTVNRILSIKQAS